MADDREAKRAAGIERIVDAAPELTAEQVVLLRRVFAARR